MKLLQTVGIWGAGEVEGEVAHLFLEKGWGNVRLYDPVEGKAKGKSLDLMQASVIKKWSRYVVESSIQEILECPVVILGSSEYLDDFMLHNKDTNKIVILAWCGCEAILSLTQAGYDRYKVLGIGGILNTLSIKRSVADAFSLDSDSIDCSSFGKYGKKMIIPSGAVRCSGIPLEFVDKDLLKKSLETAKVSRATLDEKTERWGDYLMSAYAAGFLAHCILEDNKIVLCISMLAKGEYGVNDLSCALMGVVGATGIEKILLPSLSESIVSQIGTVVVPCQGEVA